MDLFAHLWIFLGLSAAMGDSGLDVLTKRYFSGLSSYGMAMTRLLGALPFLAAAAFFIHIPHLKPGFWLILAAMLPLEASAYLLYMRSLKTAPLSLSVPFLAFTPAFMILIGYVALGENLNTFGIVGILMVVGGGYILGLGAQKITSLSLLAPFKALAYENGARLMLLAAIFLAGTSVLWKMAILRSEPFFFGIFYLLAFIIVMTIAVPLIRHRLRETLQGNYLKWLLTGACLAASTIAFSLGLKYAPAAYVVAVKSLSLVFSVLIGGIWFNERPIVPRLGGVVLMCSGVAFIALKG